MIDSIPGIVARLNLYSFFVQVDAPARQWIFDAPPSAMS